jgi:hypothetical protein
LWSSRGYPSCNLDTTSSKKDLRGSQELPPLLHAARSLLLGFLHAVASVMAHRKKVLLKLIILGDSGWVPSSSCWL